MIHGPFVLGLVDCRDSDLVGGKAINLSRLINAGFSVPGGFAVTTSAYRHAMSEGGGSITEPIAEAIRNAYRGIGSPVVAVRSSATAEDLADASMAGQYETFLDLEGEEEVLDAVRRCWKSLDSPRSRAYLKEHGIPFDDVAMGVVVQRQIAADVAGVMFTANPKVGAQHEMLIESSWGLGESVVSGIVQPDTLVLDRATGEVKTITVAKKEVWIQAGSHRQTPVPEEMQERASLTSPDVLALWKLGLKVMDHFGTAQDTEWAIQDGRLYLLQSRAITTLEEIEAYEGLLRETRRQLRAAKEEGRGDWVRHNISETLPHPTPLTWHVVRRFMSGDGGFGAMYREAGFEPSPVARSEGFLDLVAGRIYMDLARAPGMFFENYPFSFDPVLLRSDPNAAQGQPTLPTGPLMARFRIGRKLGVIAQRLEQMSTDYDRQLDTEIIPELERWVTEEKARDLTTLGTDEWMALWNERERRAMDEFGAKLMLPSLIAAMSLDRLRTFLAEHFWNEDADELVNHLSAGAAPDQTVLGADGLWKIAHGHADVADWLERYGHRAPSEFDLGTPRWRERPDAVKTMASHLAGADSPLHRHEERAQEASLRAAELEKQLSPRHRTEFRERLALANRYLRFREDGKFFLMLAYDLLRDMALEAGRRLGLGEDVFFLRPESIRDSLATGLAPLNLIERRRLDRAAETRLDLPHMIGSEDIPDLGAQKPPVGGDRVKAFPISGGVATGPVRVIFKPEEAGDPGSGYILVCPSTDPNWTPLFVKAAGLVIERGGALSHGAVVAREMGLPAVVLDGATRLFADGDEITIDGNGGAVLRGAQSEETSAAAADAEDPENLRLPPELVPPPPGEIERDNARWRNFSLLVWALFFGLVFLLPAAWLHAPIVRLLDAVLLPLVTALGRVWTVSLVALALAVFSMAGQRFLTDNRRLLVAKNRAGQLRKRALKLPKGSPRRQLMQRLAAPVQMRILSASLYPLILVLGPMVMAFLWFPARIDPASWNAAPGATAYVTVSVDGEYDGPVTFEHDPALNLAERTPPEQRIPLIRPVLEDLFGRWQRKSEFPQGYPWEAKAAALRAREELLADLGAYLRQPMPPRELSWTLATPNGASGRYPVRILTLRSKPVETNIVTGINYAPEPKSDFADGKGPVQFVRPGEKASPIELVRVTYQEDLKRDSRVFWPPVERFAGAMFPAWLIVYLLVYLPAMFVLRWLLKIP